ncbi:hypothetical protein Godav_019416 [Gossypium davidsonii]|uniref:Uncharacterized protein n=1 Tax=Gossypium davidsonii TaxID=34287 RepID=A0A7J8QZP2_GOSDV|nr:hypothetical protein [Gossypium davidsonii]
MRKTLNSSIDDQNEKLIENNDAPMVTTLKEQVAELKRQLTICKVALGNGKLYAEKEARPKLHQITQQCIIQEYTQEFSKLMLQISDLSEKQEFLWFEVGLKTWVKQELRRQGIIEITIAMTKAKSFIELGLNKDKFKSSKPKETDNGGRNHEEDGNENGGNKSTISKENEAEHVESEALDLGSMIFNSIKVKRNHKQKGLMYVDINIVDTRGGTKVLLAIQLVKVVLCGKNIDLVDWSAKEAPLKMLESQQTDMLPVELSMGLHL